MNSPGANANRQERGCFLVVVELSGRLPSHCGRPRQDQAFVAPSGDLADEHVQDFPPTSFHSLFLLPEITSQSSLRHPNPCLRLCIWRNQPTRP